LPLARSWPTTNNRQHPVNAGFSSEDLFWFLRYTRSCRQHRLCHLPPLVFGNPRSDNFKEHDLGKGKGVLISGPLLAQAIPNLVWLD
jgi:hypothetical protein